MEKRPALPRGVPLFDEDGNVTRPWVAFLTTRGTIGATVDGSVPTAPTQPAAGDWTLAIAEYGRDDQRKVNVARLEIVVATHDANVLYYSANQFIGLTPPADPADYVAIDNQPQAKTGATTLTWWVDRTDVDQTFQVVLTASSATFQSFPANVTASAPKSIVVTVAGLPAQPTGFSVVLITGTPGGVPSARFSFLLTPPVDPEYFATRIYMIETDSSYVPLVGRVWGDPMAVCVAGYTQSEFDWWPLGAESYWNFKAQSVSRAELENTVAAPTCSLHIPASTGIVPSEPTQPVGGDWSVSVLTYGHDNQSGVNVAELQVVITARPATTTYFSVFAFKGGSVPGDVSLWSLVNNTAMSAVPGGATALVWWVDRDLTATTYQIAVTASSGATIFPALATATHSVTVNAVADPSQVTNFTVGLVYSTDSGVPQGQVVHSFVIPADPEISYVNVQRVQTDAGFAVLPAQQFGDVADIGIYPPFDGGSPTSTLNGALTIGTLAVVLAAGGGAKFKAGDHVVIDSEKISIASVAGDTLTATARGIHGTAAATHASAAVVYRCLVFIGPKWTVVTGVSYWQYRALSWSRAGRLNVAAPPTFNLTAGASTGLDLSTYLSGELQWVSGKIGVNVNGTDVQIDPTTHKLMIGGVDSAKLTGTIGAGVIFAGTLAAGVILAGTISASHITAGTLVTGVVLTDKITASQLSLTNVNGNTTDFLGGNMIVKNGINLGTYSPAYMSLDSGSGPLLAMDPRSLSLYSYTVPYVTLACFGATTSYVSAPNFQISGSTVIDYNRNATYASITCSGTFSFTSISVSTVTCSGSISAASGYTGGAFTGSGVNVGRYGGVGARAFNAYDAAGLGYTGQDWVIGFNSVTHKLTLNGTDITSVKFVGGSLSTYTP